MIRNRLYFSDDRWSYTWDGENRLATMTSTPSILEKQRIVFWYDYLGRRIAKELYTPQNEEQGPGGMQQNPGAGAIQQQDEDRPPLGEINPDPGGVSGGGSIRLGQPTVWNLVDRTKYLYDGWNLIAELEPAAADVRVGAGQLGICRRPVHRPTVGGSVRGVLGLVIRAWVASREAVHAP